MIYPLPAQGGNSKYLYIRKSPLGDLGVKIKNGPFQTSSTDQVFILKFYQNKIWRKFL